MNTIHQVVDISPSVVVFGEVLFDQFPDGEKVLGGAPFNVAWALHGFGRNPVFISSIGNDSLGCDIVNKIESWGLDLSGIQVNASYETGTVDVSFDGYEPRYRICSPRAWDYIEDCEVAATGIIYYGLLALRSENNRSVLSKLCQRSRALRFFDINLRPPHYTLERLKEWVQDVDWLKLNCEELLTLSGEDAVDFENCRPILERLRDQFNIGTILLTGGAKGAIIHGIYGDAEVFPAMVPDPIIDTVGAGDSISAVVIDGILRDDSAEEILTRAVKFATKVCEIRGAASDDPRFYT